MADVAETQSYLQSSLLFILGQKGLAAPVSVFFGTIWSMKSTLYIFLLIQHALYYMQTFSDCRNGMHA